MPSGKHMWSQTAANNGTADSGINWPEGMAPSAVNDSARNQMAVEAKWLADNSGALTTGGTSTAYTLTTNTVFTSLALLNGQTLTVKFNAANGAAPTLNVDTLGAVAIEAPEGTAIPVGMIQANSIWRLTYDNSNSAFVLQNAVPLLVTTLTAETAPATADEIAIYDASATANRKMTLANVFKVVNEFTADATPAASADYVVTYDASASAAKKVLLQNLPGRLPRGYIDGCVLANGTDATNDINIAAGVCRDSTNTIDITCAAMTKQLDANWATGTNAGMRNSAAGITDATYHIYAVAKADGTQDYYAHTSTTVATVITALQAETGGTDYLYARVIGSIVRAGATILAFTQVDDHFLLTTPVIDINNATPGTSANTGTLSSMPTGFKMFADINFFFGGNGFLYVSPLDAADLAGSTSAAPLSSLGMGALSLSVGAVKIRTSTAAQIRYRATANNAVIIATLGWTHPRGRNA